MESMVPNTLIETSVSENVTSMGVDEVFQLFKRFSASDLDISIFLNCYQVCLYLDGAVWMAMDAGVKADWERLKSEHARMLALDRD